MNDATTLVNDNVGHQCPYTGNDREPAVGKSHIEFGIRSRRAINHSKESGLRDMRNILLPSMFDERGISEVRIVRAALYSTVCQSVIYSRTSMATKMWNLRRIASNASATHASPH